MDSWELTILHAWALVRTQVRVGMAGPVGLDYAGCKAALDLDGLWTPEVFRGLQIMERVWLESMSSRSGSWEQDAEDAVEDGWAEELAEAAGDGEAWDGQPGDDGPFSGGD